MKIKTIHHISCNELLLEGKPLTDHDFQPLIEAIDKLIQNKESNVVLNLEQIHLLNSLGLKNVENLRQMDARYLDFPDASFDIVAAMHIISVVPEPERVMAEMARVCKPGGQIVITNHFARETGFLAKLERLSAPFANLLGWHSDFEIGTVLKQPELMVVEQSSLPPMGMMTFLVMEKEAA